jgi:hypothetical protein
MKMIMLAIAMTCVAAPAFAWDGPGMWYRAADDANPGGGGILGTGGAHDHGIKCSDCHVDRPQEPDLQFEMTFSPELTGGAYVSGQRYTITARLTGAQLGIGCNAQDPNMHNNDGFAASFEDSSGAAAGALASDSGQTSTSCALPSPPPAGTTAMDGDCKAVFARGDSDTDTWTFSWTAPSGGPVRIYWGAVDGNCDMMSMKDAVVTGSIALGAPAMARATPRDDWRFPLALSCLAIGLVALPRRR